MIENLSKEELIKLVNELTAENQALKEKIYGSNKTVNGSTIQKSNVTTDEKVKIFMSVFNGRRDLYAKRWTSNKTGKSGYAPVCKNEFSTYKCDKFNVKCSDCVNRVLEPLTDPM